MRTTIMIIAFICILFTEPTAQQYYTPQDTTREFIDFRRLDPTNLPPIEKYARPKEEVFPLEWNIRTSGRINTGTGIWTELNPKLPRVNYLGLYFANKDTGWACGGSGEIIKTTDSGVAWTISETPITNLLIKIHSYDGQVVIAVGYDGIILRSSNGGETFHQIPSGTTSDLWGVKMINDSIGWICGTNWTLLKTTDAGQNWSPVTPGLNDHYWAVDFLNESYGMIACGGGKILKTINGGNSWIAIQAGDSRALYSIDIIDNLHIVAAGVYGKNVYSSDGGINWTTNPDVPAFSAINWIDFIDTDTGYCVRDVYNIAKTTNRGQTWFNPNPVYTISEWHIQLLQDGTGYACGAEIGGNYALNIVKRTNGLDNWSQIILNDNFYDVHFITESTGFALSGSLYKTTDNGITWEKLIGAPGGYDILFLDSLTGFIGNYTIFKTIDGGQSWYTTNIGTTGDFRRIFFVDSLTGWAVTRWSPSANAKILKTTDRGENWFEQVTQSGSDSYTSIFFKDSLNGWATSRFVWQTTNGGDNWFQRTDIPTFFGTDIYFYEDNGFSIEQLKLFKTTNSGGSWFNQLNSQHIIRNFGWLSNKHGFIVGDGVYETNDSGKTWQEILELRNIGLRKLHSPIDYLAYSIGNQGLIYEYIDTTIIPIVLISFEGKIENNKVLLNWQTASEINNQVFQIEKSLDKIKWYNIGFVEGKGTSTDGNYYTFIDNEITSSILHYRLKQIDYDGSFEYSQVIEIAAGLPLEYSLLQNYPNPFNPETTISFSLKMDAKVTLKIFDVLGKEKVTLINTNMAAGYYNIGFNASNYPSGIYFFRLIAEGINGEIFNSIKKMMLIK